MLFWPFCLSGYNSVNFHPRKLILVLKDRRQNSYLESIAILAIFSKFFPKSQKSKLTVCGLRESEKNESLRTWSELHRFSWDLAYIAIGGLEIKIYWLPPPFPEFWGFPPPHGGFFNLTDRFCWNLAQMILKTKQISLCLQIWKFHISPPPFGGGRYPPFGGSFDLIDRFCWNLVWIILRTTEMKPSFEFRLGWAKFNRVKQNWVGLNQMSRANLNCVVGQVEPNCSAYTSRTQVAGAYRSCL